MKKIAFQIDAPQGFNFQLDTSLGLMIELVKRGYEIHYYDPQSLQYKNNQVFALCKQFTNKGRGLESFSPSQQAVLTNIEDFAAVFIRQNPPFDMAYITTTYLLEIASQRGVRVINNPAALRNFSEKTFPLEFPQFMPQTLITTSFEQAEAFYNELGQEIILKPLYAYGGDGVFCIEKGDKNLRSAFTLLLERYENNPIICQQYIPAVRTIGDKRIYLVAGEVLCYFARIPQENSGVSNSRLGGGYQPCELNAREVQIITSISPRLKDLKIDLVGLDVIGGAYLTEINITSPTGIALAEQIYNTNFIHKAVDLLGL